MDVMKELSKIGIVPVIAINDAAVLSGDHQNWDARYASDAAADLQAVDAGEHDVQQNQRGGSGIEQLKRFLAGAGGKIRPAFAVDVLGEDFKNLFVVVDNQDGIQRDSSMYQVVLDGIDTV